MRQGVLCRGRCGFMETGAQYSVQLSKKALVIWTLNLGHQGQRVSVFYIASISFCGNKWFKSCYFNNHSRNYTHKKQINTGWTLQAQRANITCPVTVEGTKPQATCPVLDVNVCSEGTFGHTCRLAAVSCATRPRRSRPATLSVSRTLSSKR